MFTVRLTYKKPLAEVERHLAAHRESLDRHYADAYAQSGYFAAISKSAFFSFAIDGQASGTFTLA